MTSGCVKCGTCLDACPVGAIYDAGEQYQIDSRICVSCGACFDECPQAAIWYEHAVEE
ncbi:MAG: 4Fe-4S binding protein [Bacteroidales bacterium]|nr:4Fe-4S binding protein [Bacteroidales bacterium]